MNSKARTVVEPTAVLTIFYTFFFTGVIVREAYFINLAISVASIVNQVLKKEPIEEVLVLLSFITLSLIFGGVLSFNMEIELRRSFLLSRMTLRKRIQQQKEKNKIDLILNSVLPTDIAQRLKFRKNRDLAIAEDFRDVTIVMCDIVGFTTISAQLSPTEVFY